MGQENRGAPTKAAGQRDVAWPGGRRQDAEAVKVERAFLLTLAAIILAEITALVVLFG